MDTAKFDCQREIPSVVGNALANATGVEVFELPLDPEMIYLSIKHSTDGNGT